MRYAAGFRGYTPGTEDNRSREAKNVGYDPEEARRYLEGVDYPADKEELAKVAEGNGAPEELLEMIQTMDRPEYGEEDEVIAELEASPTAG